MARIREVVSQMVVREATAEEAEYLGVSMRSPERVAKSFKHLESRVQEEVHAIALNNKNRTVSRWLVSIGTLESSLIHPREVFAPALVVRAASIILVHNHPSGDPEPSEADYAVTMRMAKSGRMLGVPLLDHVVIGDDRFISIFEQRPSLWSVGADM